MRRSTGRRRAGPGAECERIRAPRRQGGVIDRRTAIKTGGIAFSALAARLPLDVESIFVNAHMAMLYYDPARVAALLDKYPNAMVETAATVQDLGRAPRFWRDFIVKYQDRVLFGTDGNPSSDPDTFWRPHFRFFETFDEYFEHPAQIRTAGDSPGHGRWNISGIGLPDEVLRKVYYLNALKYLPSLRDPINRQLVARGLR